MEHWKEDVLKVINNSKIESCRINFWRGGDFIRSLIKSIKKRQKKKKNMSHMTHIMASWFKIWQNFKLDNIKKALIEIDGDNKDYYEKNY